jgi:uncharacterized protein DUF4440
MDAGSNAIREFFRQYERSRNTFDRDLIASQYAESFMYAGPDGVRVVVKADVLAGWAKGRESLKTLGHASTTMTSLDESMLDEHYALVRATFVWHFAQPSAQAIDVDVHATFILYTKDGTLTIVFQHEHEDFQEALRARGVLPAQA